jgi:hypothetical protein
VSNPPSLYWAQADSQGISIDDRVNAWHAGVVKDVIVTTSGSVIAATDSGSLWAVTDSGTGLCLLDTDKPDFWCLAQGVDGADHVYAGGVGLFETDVSQTAPLLAWADISFNDGSGNPVGKVFRIAVMQPGRRIVVATAAGVFWAQIPPGPNQPGCLGALLGLKGTPRGPYTWTAAKGLPPGAFGGLALGPKGRSTDFASIAVSAWGPNTKSGLFGLFFGDWDDSGQLKFVRAETPGVDQTLMAYSSIASCKGFPATMYASCSDVNGNLFSLLSSIDGGQKWFRLDGALIKTPDVPKTIYDICTGQGNDSGRPNNALGAGPITPSRVALGWRAGPLLSDDGGRTFALIQDKYDPTGGDPSKYEHLHADIHAVLFDPTDAAGQRLFVASDGGLVRSDDLGVSFVSTYNQKLLNLQLLGTTAAREWYGTLGASPTAPGLLGVGTQDNGNLWCFVKDSTTPWYFFEGGDGRVMAFLRNGALVHYFGDDDHPQLSLWDGAKFQSRGIIPYVPGHEIKSPAFERVAVPWYRNPEGQLMYGVAGMQTFVYGLFGDDNGDNFHWEYMGGTPTGLNGISSVCSWDGQDIFAATSGGRIFRFSPPDNWSHEMPVAGLPPDGDPNRTIPRIVMAGPNLAFAVFNRSDGSSGSVLAWTGQQWNVTLGGYPNAFVFAMELDVSTDAPNVYIATDDKVYCSTDFGLTWGDVSSGLPRRPHCSDLRIAEDQNGVYLYLSTYGRSVWVSTLLTKISIRPHDPQVQG